MRTDTRIRITGLRAVGVPVADQDRAVGFYEGSLGFEKRVDITLGAGLRWIEVAPGGSDRTSIALLKATGEQPSGVETGIRLATPDAGAAHAELRLRGVDVDELLNWTDAPPMFALRDPNGVEIIEEAERRKTTHEHTEQAIHRHPSEEPGQGRLDLRRHARLGGVFRNPRLGPR